MERPSTRQLLAAFGVPLLIVIAATLYLLIVNDRLPEQVAIHWGGDGAADGFISRANLPWFVAAITFAVSAPFVAISIMSTSKSFSPGLFHALPASLSAFLGVVMVLTATVSLDSTEAPNFPTWVIPVSLAVAFGAGVIASKLAGPAPAIADTAAPAPSSAERFPIPEGQTAVWSGRTPMGRNLMALVAFFAFMNIVVAGVTSWWLLGLVVVTVLVILTTSSFDVTAGPSGVRVAGVLGFPRTTVPLNQIVMAEAGSVKAMQFGGFGWRVRGKGQTAVLTRSGPALTVTRTDGAQLHVTLDDPERPAAVISALLDQRSSV